MFLWSFPRQHLSNPPKQSPYITKYDRLQSYNEPEPFFCAFSRENIFFFGTFRSEPYFSPFIVRFRCGKRVFISMFLRCWEFEKAGFREAGNFRKQVFAKFEKVGFRALFYRISETSPNRQAPV